MRYSAKDVLPLTQARAKFAELADQAKAGAEKIIIEMARALSPSSAPTGWTITIAWNASTSICC